MAKLAKNVLALLLAGLQLIVPGALYSAPVVTAPVALDDQPLNTASSVKPNIMFTLDNSGSMSSEYAPESTANDSGKNCYRNDKYNRLYYNPSYTYLPPALADGSRLPNSTYAAAWKDGFDTTQGTVNFVSNGSARYAKYTDSTTPQSVGTCHPNASYTIINLNSATAAEQQNYANWYSYYRNRMMAMKSSAGEAFRAIGEEFRVGFHTINGPSATGTDGGFLPVDSFVGAHRTAWYTMFYRQETGNSTPLRAAMTRVGEYFRAATSPINSSSTITDPVQYSCQPNYHILSTDGYWNGSGGSGVAGSQNWNNLLPNNPALLSALGSEFNTTFTAGQPWPAPYRENSTTASTNNLADIAAYYWQTDLRPLLPNDVPTSGKDPASWQHVTQFTMAFAPQGTIPFPNGLAAVKAGTVQWPVPTNDSPKSVDDLWAAALVGHGQYFNVSSPDELLNKLSAALQDIAGRQTSGTPAASTSSDYEAATAPYSFRASFVPGEWTGKLEVRDIDPLTGVVQPTALWDARAKLDSQVVGAGWDTGRLIATMNTSTNTAVPFRFSSISALQQSTLNSDAGKASLVLDYLRGNRAYEDNAPATSIPVPTNPIGLFRERRSVLGPMINSAPNYQGPPSAPYVDSYNPGYSAFKAAKAARTPMIYVGASDGMLHAFKATVGDSDSGQEKWAYVPGMLYKNGVDGLAGWSYKYSDPVPDKFSHRYRVDQSPRITDIDFGNAGGVFGAPDWRTVLVAGLNKGGKGFYALDVTNPDASTEADVAGKVLWEFTGETVGDPKMGYSFGTPSVIKTRRFGWVIAVTSGYNNVAGTGHLWLLNPKTGAVLHRFDTGAGTPAIPSGLAQINAFRQSSYENIYEQIYGTDLLGNLWRFDVSSTAAAGWTSAAVKVINVGQPLTTAPVPTLNPYRSSERWVVFGSGKLLSQGDVATAASNSALYAIKDGSGAAPLNLVTPILKTDLVAVATGAKAPEGAAVKGWYFDTAGTGQINFAPEIRRGVLLWGANLPSSANVCTSGMQGTFRAMAVSTGANQIAGSTSIPVTGGLMGISVAKVKRTVATSTSNYASIRVGLSKAQEIETTNAVQFNVRLNSGRSNIRYIALQ
jgi:type IV pilus assembly protein PilY1